MTMNELKFEKESYQIRSAVLEVYREAVYQECLEEESALQRILFAAQRALLLHIKASCWFRLTDRILSTMTASLLNSER